MHSGSPDANFMLKARIQEDMKLAMKSGEKARLGVIRLILAAIKQVEVDTRKDLSEADVIGIMTKMVKQRRDSISQFEAAARQDLADQEAFEIGIIHDYLPQMLNEAEILSEIDAQILNTGAAGPKDMGKLMAALKTALHGRADMSQVSALVKQRLG